MTMFAELIARVGLSDESAIWIAWDLSMTRQISADSRNFLSDENLWLTELSVDFLPVKEWNRR